MNEMTHIQFAGAEAQRDAIRHAYRNPHGDALPPEKTRNGRRRRRLLLAVRRTVLRPVLG
jgi:hypothetical protein